MVVGYQSAQHTSALMSKAGIAQLIDRPPRLPGAASAPRAVYLDHHATTPIDPRVAQAVLRAMTETFGNPNSADHVFGERAAAAIEDARAAVARLAGAEPEDVCLPRNRLKAIAQPFFTDDPPQAARFTRDRRPRPLRTGGLRGRLKGADQAAVAEMGGVLGCQTAKGLDQRHVLPIGAPARLGFSQLSFIA
jgi:hypothetical protein